LLEWNFIFHSLNFESLKTLKTLKIKLNQITFIYRHRTIKLIHQKIVYNSIPSSFLNSIKTSEFWKVFNCSMKP